MQRSVSDAVGGEQHEAGLLCVAAMAHEWNWWCGTTIVWLCVKSEDVLCSVVCSMMNDEPTRVAWKRQGAGEWACM